MNEEMNEQAKKCIELYEKMNPRMQSIILWALLNRQTITEICRGKNMPEQIWNYHMEHAIEEDDLLKIVLLEYKRIHDEKYRQENYQDEE